MEPAHERGWPPRSPPMQYQARQPAGQEVAVRRPPDVGATRPLPCFIVGIERLGTGDVDVPSSSRPDRRRSLGACRPEPREGWASSTRPNQPLTASGASGLVGKRPEGPARSAMSVSERSAGAEVGRSWQVARSCGEPGAVAVRRYPVPGMGPARRGVECRRQTCHWPSVRRQRSLMTNRPLRTSPSTAASISAR